MGRHKKQQAELPPENEPPSIEPEQKHDQVTIELSGIREEIGKLVRRVNDVQKSVDILYQDREILEDIQGSIQSLKEITQQHQKFIDGRIKDVKGDIAHSQFVTEENTKEVKETVADSIGNLVDNIAGKKTIIIKETFFARVRKWLQKKGVKAKQV